MADLTPAQIVAAKNGDSTAITAMVDMMEDRISYLSFRHATSSGRTDHQLKDDLAQEARIAVWQAIERFAGTTPGQWFAFAGSRAEGAISDARKAESRQGVSRPIAGDFERALALAEGDPYEAERLATTEEALGVRKMSPEMAYAARLSYMGLTYLDAPLPGYETEDGMTLGESLVDRAGVPEDLLTSDDVASERSKETTRRVHATLDAMGEQQRIVLSALTGIRDVAEYGTAHDDELAADYGIPRKRVSVIRSKGKDRFAELYTRFAELYASSAR